MSGARLLIDVGNSRVKWAVVSNGVLAESKALSHHGDPATAVARIADLEASPVDRPVFGTIHIANVTGTEHGDALSAALRARFGVTPIFARPQRTAQGLVSAYAEPDRLGVDRWLGLLAARRRAFRASHHMAVCVASCGTALTFDAADAAGRHLGGIIAPGLLAAQKAVLGSTRFVSAGPDVRYTQDLGMDTESCVRQGALHACAGLLDRLAARQPDAMLLLTGGDAATLRPCLADASWIVVPDLVLEGLLTFDEHAPG